MVHDHRIAQETVDHQIFTRQDIAIPSDTQLLIPDRRAGERKTRQLLHGIVDFIGDFLSGPGAGEGHVDTRNFL